MTSNAWAEALLVAVLLAPLVSVVLAIAAAAPNDDHRWTTGGCAVAAAGCLVLLVTGQHPHVARLAPDDVALASAAATALLAIAVPTSTRTAIVAAAVTVATCGITAGSPGHASTVGPVLGIAAAIVLVALARRSGRLTIAAMAGGAVVIAGGVHTGGHGGAAAVVVGAVVVGIAGSSSTRRAPTVIVPLALLMALHVGPQLSGTSAARTLAVVLGLGGAGLAVLPSIVPRCASPSRCAAVVPWIAIAAIGPIAGTPSAARALAAGAVLVLVLGGPLAMLATAPGVAVLVYAIAEGQGWPRIVLGLLLAVTALGLTNARAVSGRVGLRPVDGAAVAAGIWLVVRPTSWTWTRISGLSAYSDGTALAAATALIAGVLLTISGGHVAPEPIAPWIVDEDLAAAPSPTRVEVGIVAVAALMGLVAAALVRSARL